MFTPLAPATGLPQAVFQHFLKLVGMILRVISSSFSANDGEKFRETLTRIDIKLIDLLIKVMISYLVLAFKIME